VRVQGAWNPANAGRLDLDEAREDPAEVSNAIGAGPLKIIMEGLGPHVPLAKSSHAGIIDKRNELRYYQSAFLTSGKLVPSQQTGIFVSESRAWSARWVLYALLSWMQDDVATGDACPD
jgi:hypothetical protein